MKNLLKLEELALFAAAITALYFQPLHFSWYLWPFIFLAPDLSMVGYLFNTTVGAYVYNFFHHKLLAVVVALAGLATANTLLVFIGLVFFAHSSFDRIMGYGLKYTDSFKHTSVD